MIGPKSLLGRSEFEAVVRVASGLGPESADARRQLLKQHRVVSLRRALGSWSTSTDRRERALAAFVLGQAWGEHPTRAPRRATELLTALLDDADPMVRAPAAFGLGVLGRKEAKPRLAAFASDPKQPANVAAAATQALGMLASAGSSAAVRSLVALLDSGRVAARRWALFYLAHLQAPPRTASSSALRMVRSRNPQTAAEALLLLVKLRPEVARAFAARCVAVARGDQVASDTVADALELLHPPGGARTKRTPSGRRGGW